MKKTMLFGLTLLTLAAFVYIAYTKYAFFEWSLIIYDVAFDAVTALDFQRFEFTVRDLSAVHGHGDIDDDKNGCVE